VVNLKVLANAVYLVKTFLREGSVPDKGRWFLGKGKTSFHEKKSFPLPQTPTLFKKSEVFYKVRTVPYG